MDGWIDDLGGFDADSSATTFRSFLRFLLFFFTRSDAQIPLDKLAISKNITKRPEEYPDAHTQPHVQVAIALRAMGRHVQVGDTIQYIICESNDPSKQLIADRAFHPDQVRKDGLTPDYEWYLANQVLPPLSRLCEPIEGTDSAMLAMCLGLDPVKYSASSRANDVADGDTSFVPMSLADDQIKFRSCEKLNVTCPHCHQVRPRSDVSDVLFLFSLFC